MISKDQYKELSQIVSRESLGLDKVSTAEEFTKILYEIGVKQVTDNGQLPFPTVFVLDTKHCLVLDITPFMRCEEEKDNLSALLRNMASNPNIQAIAMVYEAWMVSCTEEDINDVKEVSSHPDRIECILTQGEWRYGDSYMIGGRLIRAPQNKISVVEIIAGQPELAGRFSNLFIPLPKPGEFMN